MAKKTWREIALGQDSAIEEPTDEASQDENSSWWREKALAQESPLPGKKEEPLPDEGLTWWDNVAGGKESPGPLAKGFDKKEGSFGKAYADESHKDSFTEELEKPMELESHSPAWEGPSSHTEKGNESSVGRSSFARAFAKARLDAKAAGKDPSKSIFTWNGKKYNTKLA
jgi:hypothetical protein